MAISKIDVSNMLDETLPVANGGTGVTTAADLANTGNMVKIATATFSADASVEFTSLSDYNCYEFHFYNMKATTDGNNDLLFSMSTDGTNYTVPMYTSNIYTYNKTDGTASGGSFSSGAFASENDTNGVIMSERFGGGSAETQNGKIIIYDASSTTKYKHYQTIYSGYHSEDYSWGAYLTGHGQTTSALAGIKISIGSGTIATGTVVQYGLKV